MFDKVEELRERLKKEYPGLNSKVERPKKIMGKALSVEPSVVRPTITPNEIVNMLHQSSRHKNIKDLDYGPLPKRQKPFKIKVQEYEAETSLDCFMKHIATKSFEKYVTEKTPGFRKSAITEVYLPEQSKKAKKKLLQKPMNVGNLEIFGQIEVRSKSPKFQQQNLKMVEKGIKRNVKSWCLQEKRKIDVRSQIIDHYTFKHKH